MDIFTHFRRLQHPPEIQFWLQPGVDSHYFGGSSNAVCSIEFTQRTLISGQPPWQPPSPYGSLPANLPPKVLTGIFFGSPFFKDFFEAFCTHATEICHMKTCPPPQGSPRPDLQSRNGPSGGGVGGGGGLWVFLLVATAGHRAQESLPPEPPHHRDPRGVHRPAHRPVG